MRVTQGCFSFLPDLTDLQISKQVQYCLDNGWAVSLEHTDDPHPRNTYWEMWGHPMFDIRDAKAIKGELAACRRQRPACEPGFMLARYQRARLRQAGRLVAHEGPVRAEMLMEFDAQDILSSRVFQQGEA